MADETSQSSEKAWFADWRTNAVFTVIALLVGGGGGFFGGNLKTTAQGITQDQADVRYITKDEAEKRAEKRDKQNERMEKKIDDNQQKNESEQKEVRKILLEILQNQKSEK